MNFKRSFEKYKWDEATDEEKAFVESEIEKIKKVNEYLGIRINERDKNEERSKSLVKKNEKLKIVCAVLSIAVVAQTVLGIYMYKSKVEPAWEYANGHQQQISKKVNLWDAIESNVTDATSEVDIALDLYFKMHKLGIYDNAKLTEVVTLNDEKPIYYYSFENDGIYGKYHLQGVINENTFDAAFKTNVYDANYLLNDRFAIKEHGLDQGTLEEALAGTKDENATVYVTFTDLVSSDDIATMINEDEDGIIKWIGIDTREFDYEDYPLIGLATSATDLDLNFTEYSMLSEDMHEEEMTGEEVEDRVITMISYQADHKEAIKAIGAGKLVEGKYYEMARNHISKNKVRAYGVTLTGTKEQIQNMCAKLDVKCVKAEK